MSQSAREALNRLVAALEHHLDLAQNIDVVQPSLLEHAEDALRDAFFTYDDTLFTEFDVELPFEIVEDDDDDEEDPLVVIPGGDGPDDAGDQLYELDVDWLTE